jgi:hypothetical protein
MSAGPTQGPVCGETNALPSDPGTLQRGVTKSWNPAGVQACVSEQIAQKTQEMKQLCIDPNEPLNPAAEQKIKEAIRSALSVATQAGLMGFHSSDVTALQATTGAALGRYLNLKVKRMSQLQTYATNLSILQGAVDMALPDKRGHQPRPDRALLDSMSDVLALALQAQRLGVNPTSALAEAGGAVGAFIDMKVDRMNITRRTLENFPDLQLPDEEVLEQIRDATKVAKQAQLLGADASKVLLQLADSLSALIARDTANLKALRARLSSDPSLEKDVLSAQIKLDLLLKAAKQLGVVPSEVPARNAIHESTEALSDQLDKKLNEPEQTPAAKEHKHHKIRKAKQHLRMRYLGDGIYIPDTGGSK